MTTPLLIPVPIRADESLHGLVVRAHKDNHYASLADTLDNDDFAKNRSFGYVLGCLAKGRYTLENLAIRTHNELARLEAAKLKLEPPYIGSITDDYIVTSRWRLCPLCALEDPYHRRSWALVWNTACTKHGTVLIDQCPSCSAEMSMSPKLPVRCPDCAAHVALNRPPEARTLQFSAALEHAFQLHTDGDPVPLAQIHARLMACIAIADTEFLRGRHRLSPHMMSVAEVAKLVLRFGPSAMTEDTLFEFAMSWMARCRDRWPLLPRAWTVTLDGVAKQAGAHVPVGLARALAAADAGEVRPARKSPSEDDVLLAWTVPFEVAAHILDISPFVLRRLVRSGLIDAPLANPNVSESGALRTVSIDHLHELISRLEAMAKPADAPDAFSARTSLEFSGAEKVIPLALEGKVTLYRADGLGLTGFRVRSAETPRGVASRQVIQGHTTIEKAATRLKTYRAVIDHLVEGGRLASIQKGLGLRRLIPLASIDEFDREFVLVGALAKSHGLNPTNLTEKLATVKVYPAIGPKIDGSLVSAFRRRDIRDVDFDVLRRLKNYPTKTGRPPSGPSAATQEA